MRLQARVNLESLWGGVDLRLYIVGLAVTGRKGHYSTVSSLECFIEVSPDFLCLFMKD